MNLKSFHQNSDEGPGWMATFADLMTLLLVFFILMFSISSVKSEQFEKVISSIQSSLSGLSNTTTFDSTGVSFNPKADQLPIIPPAADSNLDKGSNDSNSNKDNPSLEQAENAPTKLSTQPSVGDKGTNWQELANTLRSRLSDAEQQRQVKINLPQDGTVSIQVQGGLMFDSGSAYLNPEVDPVLDTLNKLFKEYSGFSINIKGHTDNIPISSPEFESNWELSAVRATTVLRYFVNQGLNPRRFTATGYGSSVPLESNETEEGRTKNRRIEFVLEQQHGEVLH